jgi:F-type H+-transporting ATPase subunit delta
MTVSPKMARSLVKILQTTTAEERKELAAFSEFYETNPSFRRFLHSPHFSQKQKQGLIERSLAPQCSRATISYLLFLESLDCFAALPSILDHLDDRQGVEQGLLTTAKPLANEQANRLKKQFEEMTGQKILLDQKTDPSVIGGFLFKVGNRVYDSTIKHRLQNLKTYLGKTSCN